MPAPVLHHAEREREREREGDLYESALLRQWVVCMPIFSLRRDSALRSGLLLFNLPHLVCQSVVKCVVPVDGNRRSSSLRHSSLYPLCNMLVAIAYESGARLRQIFPVTAIVDEVTLVNDRARTIKPADGRGCSSDAIRKIDHVVPVEFIH